MCKTSPISNNNRHVITVYVLAKKLKPSESCLPSVVIFPYLAVLVVGDSKTIFLIQIRESS